MGLAEEEVLIRDDSGLLLDVGETRVPKSQEWSKKLTKTICLSLGFLVLGLCVAIPGPTLLDLEDQVKATTFEMMIVFASRSVGYLLGALLGGVLFDCFDKQLLLFCTLLVSSVATVAIPWSLTLVVMATMFALQGITMGALDTGGNVFCIQLWGKKNPPFMQTLHFAFGIGAFVAPLLAKPFLSNGSVVSNAANIVQGNIPVAPFLTEQLHSNKTRRYIEFSYLDLNQPNTLEDPVYGENEAHVLKKKKDSKHNSLLRTIKSGNDLTRSGDIFNIHERLKRQSGNDDDGYSMWKWKRHRSKRDLTDNSANDPALETTTSKPDNHTKTDESDSIANVDASKEGASPNKDIAQVDGAVNTEDKDNENRPDTEGLVLDSSLNGTALNTNPDINVVKNANVSGSSQTTKGINSDTSSEMTTMITTQLTTEMKFHKPSAVTDTDREPGTADGKVISKHLEDHKGEIPANTGDVSETDTGSSDEKKMSTVDLSIGKAVTVKASTNNQTLADTGNNTKSNDSKSANVEHFSSSTSSSSNSSGKNVLNSPSVSSTLKPKNYSETISGNKTEPDSAENTTKLSTKQDTAVTTAITNTNKLTTTTKKPTSTTLKPTSTTQKSTFTTQMPTSTTQKPTITTQKLTFTTQKPTSTTQKSTFTTQKPTTTTQKQTTTTAATTTKEKTTTKTTLKKQPSPDKSEANQPSSKVTTTLEVSTTNSSIIATSNTSYSDDKLTTTEVSMKPESTVDSFLNNAIHAVKNISKIQFAYLITGLALFLIAVLFLVLYCKDKRRLTPGRDLEELERFRSPVTCAKAVLIILLGFFFFCYMGLEVTFGALVTTFAVDFNKWPKEQGAMAAAIFWGSLATGRGLSIFLSKCCGPTVMLIIDLIFMIIGGLVLSVGIHFYDKLLWLGTLILGLGMSSAFPAGISWAENYFHLTGKSTAVFVIGSALGQMIVPVVVGYMFEYLGAIVLMYTSLVLSIMSLVIFILMQCVAGKSGTTLKIHDRNGFLPLEEDDDNEENLEMEDFVHFDKSQARLRHDKRGGGNAEYHTLISDLDDD